MSQSMNFKTQVDVYQNDTFVGKSQISWVVVVETREDRMRGITVFASRQEIILNGKTLNIEDIEVEGVTGEKLLDGDLEPKELHLEDGGNTLLF